VRSRLIISLIIGVVALPVVFIALIDPLEGGLALLLALPLGLGVRLLSGVPVPRWTWVPCVATLAVGILALALAIAGMPGEQEQGTGPDVTAPNPLGVGVRALIWVYRLGVLAVLGGAVLYLVRIVQALRATGNAQPGELSR
jgi:ribose/xylose/arabinose/galactoside ABC-type transport system permease subunit